MESILSDSTRVSRRTARKQEARTQAPRAGRSTGRHALLSLGCVATCLMGLRKAAVSFCSLVLGREETLFCLMSGLVLRSTVPQKVRKTKMPVSDEFRRRDSVTSTQMLRSTIAAAAVASAAAFSAPAALPGRVSTRKFRLPMLACLFACRTRNVAAAERNPAMCSWSRGGDCPRRAPGQALACAREHRTE